MLTEVSAFWINSAGMFVFWQKALKASIFAEAAGMK